MPNNKSNVSNSNGRRTGTLRGGNGKSLIGFVQQSPNIRYKIFVNLAIPRPIKVIKDLVVSGSTGITTATGTNTSVGIQALSVSQISNFTTRFSGFREYLLKGVRIVIQPVAVAGTGQGMVAFYLDEASNVTPSSTSLNNIPHCSMPVIQENSRALEVSWRAHDLDELGWQLLATAVPVVAYLKWYGDSANTALNATSGVQLFMIDYYFTMDFRGLA